MFLRTPKENELEMVEILLLSEKLIQNYYNFIKSTHEGDNINDDLNGREKDFLLKKNKEDRIERIEKDKGEKEFDLSYELSEGSIESFNELEKEVLKNNLDNDSLMLKVEDDLENKEDKQDNNDINCYTQNNDYKEENNLNKIIKNDIKVSNVQEEKITKEKINEVKPNLKDKDLKIYYTNQDNMIDYNYYSKLKIKDWISSIDNYRYLNTVDTSLVASGILKNKELASYKSASITTFLETWKKYRNNIAHDQFDGINKEGISSFCRMLKAFVSDIKDKGCLELNELYKQNKKLIDVLSK